MSSCSTLTEQPKLSPNVINDCAQHLNHSDRINTQDTTSLYQGQLRVLSESFVYSIKASMCLRCQSHTRITSHKFDASDVPSLMLFTDRVY